MKRLMACAFVLAIGIPGWAQAQPAKSGGEFQVNVTTTSSQSFPRISMDSSGKFVVVWQSYSYASYSYDIFGRLGDGSGPGPGGEFLVPTNTGNYQYLPDVAKDSAGNFIVVWDSFDSYGNQYEIKGRMFDSSGAPKGAEFSVNSFTTDFQRAPSVAVDPNTGDFVVVWQSFGQDGYYYGVFGQRFDSTGSKVGGEFQVSQTAYGNEEYPRIAARGNGEFVVVWESEYLDGDDFGIAARFVDSSGADPAGEFAVNTYTTYAQRFPAVSGDNDGKFVVVWQSQNQDGGATGVFGQRFDSTGAFSGNEFRANTNTLQEQQFPVVAMAQNGDFVVAWESYGLSGFDVFVKSFDSLGYPTSGDVLANTSDPNFPDQRIPAIDMNKATGDFAVVWESYAQDGDSIGVFGQQFSNPSVCIVGDADADGICDSADNCLDHYNPGQEDLDTDGLGDPCDIIVTMPLSIDAVDCQPAGRAGIPRPTITWDPGNYDKYRVLISWRPNFPKKQRVTSGKTLRTVPQWSPSRKKWTRVCKNAGTEVYIKIFGVDTDVGKNNARRKTFSDVSVPAVIK